MNRLSLCAWFCAVALTVAVRPLAAQNEARSSTIGTIDLDSGEQHDDSGNRLRGVIKLEKEEKKKDPYLVTQEETIAYFENLAKDMAMLSQGGSAHPGELSENQTLHTAAAYLYCAIKKGTCPDFLEAVREIDVISAIESGIGVKKSACPAMQRFWGVWVRNDMQKKMNFQVRMSYMRARSDFNQKQLPAYVPAPSGTCDAAVKAFAAVAGENKAAYFKKRYSGDNTPQQALARVLDMLKLFQRENVNLLQATMPR